MQPYLQPPLLRFLMREGVFWVVFLFPRQNHRRIAKEHRRDQTRVRHRLAPSGANRPRSGPSGAPLLFGCKYKRYPDPPPNPPPQRFPAPPSTLKGGKKKPLPLPRELTNFGNRIPRRRPPPRPSAGGSEPRWWWWWWGSPPTHPLRPPTLPRRRPGLSPAPGAALAPPPPFKWAGSGPAGSMRCRGRSGAAGGGGGAPPDRVGLPPPPSPNPPPPPSAGAERSPPGRGATGRRGRSESRCRQPRGLDTERGRVVPRK